MQRFLEVFIPLLVAIDPMGVIPIFLGMTATLSPERRRKVGIEASLTGLAISVGFMFLGQAIFRFLGITEADFRIAGGIILMVLAVLDLLISGKPAVNAQDMGGIVPLGMPLIAGPATLTTILVLSSNPQLGYTWTLAGIVSVFSLLIISMHFSDLVVRHVGMPALKALSKLVMVLLAAIAVNFIRVGIMQSIAAGR